MKFTDQDVKFLENLGFKRETPDLNEISEEDRQNYLEWTTYNLVVDAHPFIEELSISIGIEPDTISVFGKYDAAIIEKPFSHENLLAIMAFLRLPLSSNTGEVSTNG